MVKRLVIAFIVLILAILSFLFFWAPKQDIPESKFKGPQGAPFVIGPNTPPPEH